MFSYLLRRLAHALLVLVAMSLLVFAGVYLIGNPVDVLIDPQATQAEAARAAAALGLDRPLPVQYWHFVTQAVTGNFGHSFVSGTGAMQLVLHRMPATLELALTASLISLIVGVPLGLWAGRKPGSLGARLITGSALLGYSLPTFWLGVLLVTLFSVALGWLPPAGRGTVVDVFGVPLSILTGDGWRHLIMPALNLALFQLALMIRLVSSGTQDAYGRDYVRFARAKGVPEGRIARVHVLRNIALPVVTVAGLELGSVIAFAIVTETIFSWPGMGKLLIDSIEMLDRPVIVAYLLVVVCVFVLINLLVDILYMALDPRVRLAEATTT
jgi:peptide/nickel transport system permease protein